MSGPVTIRVATYNIHDALGRDRRYDPQRIVDILQAIDADIFALQEVTLDKTGKLAQRLAATGMQVVDGTLLERGAGRYGNLVLMRSPAIATRLHDLSWHGREPRNAIEVQWFMNGLPLSLLATHLGLNRRERNAQLERLTGIASANSGISLILGDLNVWSGQSLRSLVAAGFVYRAVRSFPAWPGALAALDRILVREPLSLRRCYRYESPLTRVASDHYPLVAELRIVDG